MEKEVGHLEKLVSHFEKYSALTGAHMTDFYVLKHWENLISEGWKEQLLSFNDQQLIGRSMAQQR